MANHALFLMNDYESRKSLIQDICNELERSDCANDLINKYLVKPSKVKKVKKDGQKPPKTAYQLFCEDNRKELQDDGYKMIEISQKLGAKWKSLSEDEKQPYMDKNKKLKAELTNESKSDEEQDDEVKPVKPVKKSNKPKQ